MDKKKLAEDFYRCITDRKAKLEVFEHISDEQFEAIKASFTSETRLRNEKRYYRYENILTNQIEWCVESKLGSNLKSASFKDYLLRLGRNRRADRNNNPSVYVHPEPVKKNKAKYQYQTSEELEQFFLNDPNGKRAQPTALTPRPTELRPLQN
ncbi:hypothetical protein K6754_23845 [Vibrio alginolyticus]|uniref:hypothetical protein n=1 Tax=Vibrio alginolyticus TaxID=663 RepID=UPI001EF15851|nr:hypothetical protein [Vibrio alginolyticus]EMC8460724.1 hypothetical protein [Vibrio alginolyticus]EME3934701.1 hypothetical protein [Vibrio alginolyticus]ULF93927.1 hypothetical protein K6754_23845 [Vibrio alginolyticus]